MTDKCEGAKLCRTVVPQKHHILPVYMGGNPTEAMRAIGIMWVYLCGRHHDSVHWLLRHYEKCGGTPPWHTRWRVGVRVRRLAAEGWRRYQEKENQDAYA